LKNPFLSVPAPRVKNEFFTYGAQEAVNPFTQQEIDTLVNADDKTYIPNFIKLMANCGARPGEIISLRWDDIDFEKRTININKTTIHGVDNNPKTISSIRCIDMIEGAYEALQAQYELTCNFTHVFVNSSNYRFYSHDIINLLMKKRLVKYNIPVRSLYQLRHSFASRMIKSGVDITWVSKMLGHKNSAITLEVYTHYLKEDESTRARNLEKINQQLASL